MSTDTWLMGCILGAPVLTSAILIGFRRKMTKVAGAIAVAGAALSLAAALALLPALYRSAGPTLALSWVPAAGIELDLHVDWLTLPFVITEAAVTLVAVIYAWGYHHTDERTPYFYALLMIFAVGMAGTTLADDMFLFYTFWELMLIASCALILFWGDSPKRNAVALKYFIFTHFGSLLVLVALVMLYTITGNDTFSALRQGIAGNACSDYDHYHILSYRFLRQNGDFPAALMAPGCPYSRPYARDDYACRSYVEYGHIRDSALSNEHFQYTAAHAFCCAHDGCRHHL